MEELQQEIARVEQELAAMHALRLPQQLIHGDLHYDNVLADERGVTGVLDFEFCAHDWRAMELAICLSKYASEKDPLPYFKDFIEGYGSVAKLSPDEVNALPDLIALRILSNVIYFVGRAVSGEDSIASLTSRAGQYVQRLKWLRTNRANIIAIAAAAFECSDS